MDIDCILNNLDHQPIFETTKQNIILNIDTPLSSKEINNRLKKINNIMAEIVNVSANAFQTAITKG